MMLFRIWFQVLFKIALAAFALLIVATVCDIIWSSAEWPAMLRRIGMIILAPMGLLGAALAVPLLVLRRPTACPLCREPGRLVQLERWDIGVQCEHCGVVHLHLIKDFRLRIAAPASRAAEETHGS